MVDPGRGVCPPWYNTVSTPYLPWWYARVASLLPTYPSGVCAACLPHTHGRRDVCAACLPHTHGEGRAVCTACLPLTHGRRRVLCATCLPITHGRKRVLCATGLPHTHGREGSTMCTMPPLTPWREERSMCTMPPPTHGKRERSMCTMPPSHPWGEVYVHHASLTHVGRERGLCAPCLPLPKVYPGLYASFSLRCTLGYMPPWCILGGLHPLYASLVYIRRFTPLLGYPLV